MKNNSEKLKIVPIRYKKEKKYTVIKSNTELLKS